MTLNTTMSLDTSPKVPADLLAEVRSVSAVGEQYVELLPCRAAQTDSGPYLEDGSRISRDKNTIPQEVGPMLDQLSALVDSIPSDRIPDLLDETFKALNGAGPDFQSLLDSASKVAGDANAVSDQTLRLIDDVGPLLDSQAESTEAIRTWARSLAGVTEQLVQNDPELRTVLQRGPGFAQEVSQLLTQIKPTLPVLLAKPTSVTQVLLTYNPALEQLLVIFPGIIAAQQSFGLPQNNPTGLPSGDFALTISDPVSCTVGFLPPSQWRSPEDMTTVDTPDGLYCKLRQDSPISVRGARNYPCIEHPGKRVPTVELCNDPKGYQPLAIREHSLGPYPFDPNLVSQGIPVDDRVDFQDRIYAPLQGTPLPPGAVPAGTPPVAAPSGAPAPATTPVPAAPPAPTAAPVAVAPPPPPGNSINGTPLPLYRPRRPKCLPAVVRSPLHRAPSAATERGDRHLRWRTTTRPPAST